MRNKQEGFSLIELLIVVAIILIIAAIAIPNLLRSRLAANEASAVASLRTINTACNTYNSTYGSFPPALRNLQAPSSGNPSSTAADLIDQILALGSKNGYTFTYVPGAANASYTITAVPITMNQSGLREFYTDTSGVIRFSIGTTADASSSPLQ
jgi:type IV pilus assembly protein PilA